MSTQTTGAKPLGMKGRAAGVMMNIIHAGQYRNIIRRVLAEYEPDRDIHVLDIGCGGGRAIKLFCALGNTKVYGIDHSPDMVRLARRVNRDEIAKGNVDIEEGDVADIRYEDGRFDIVAAFDTINFWPDMDKAMREVSRVLKRSGMFLIVNGYPKAGTKWYEFVRYKSAHAYRDMLTAHDFNLIQTDIQKNTIVIKAFKSSHISHTRE